MEIVIASHNLGKIREFREILNKILGLDVDSLLAYPNYVAPKEEGNTLVENATLKAVHAAKALNKVVIADDSGLFVSALQGAPGVHSAYYAGEQANDRDNRKKLLEALAGKQGMQRSAYFECVLVMASPTETLKITTGRVEGMIAEEEKGRHGFGYDPLFIKHDYDKTFAELAEDVKNRISHRRKALDAMIPSLEGLVARSK